MIGTFYKVQAFLQIDHRVQEPPVPGSRTLTGGEELEVVPPFLRGDLGSNVLGGRPGQAVVCAAHHVEEIDILCRIMIHVIIK